MGKAILAGLMSAGIDPSQVAASTKSAASAERLTDEYGIDAFARDTHDQANSMAAKQADIILLAVKPAYVIEVLTEIAPSLRPDALVISVAAGITTDAMQAAVPSSVAVVRSMPNTPAIVGRAVTGLARGSRSTGDQLQTAIGLFETVGKVLVVDESQIDALSTVSGSGPAYVFYLIEQFTEAARGLGFTDEQAKVMVQETFLGASELLAVSGKTPEELRKQVTSPNGTTMRAVAVLESANLSATFEKATAAALARAKEIAEGNL